MSTKKCLMIQILRIMAYYDLALPGGEPPTGEPYAVDPHVRFGGGSGRV